MAAVIAILVLILALVSPSVVMEKHISEWVRHRRNLVGVAREREHVEPTTLQDRIGGRELAGHRIVAAGLSICWLA